VLDDDGRVVGIISEADLLHKMEFAGLGPHVGLFERKRRRSAREKSEAETASDLMTSPAVVARPAESLTSVARRMETERIKRVPVVDGDGRLLGIVSRHDLLRSYLRDDQIIRSEVVEEVLHRTLWIQPGRITVTVDQGVVSLSGAVDRRSTIALLVRLVEMVAGVVDVVDHLSYHFDDTTEPDRHPPAYN